MTPYSAESVELVGSMEPVKSVGSIGAIESSAGGEVEPCATCYRVALPETAIPPPGDHGGDIWSVATSLDMDPLSILDLSASMNPFAPDVSQLAAEALRGGVLSHYPDDSRAAEALSRTAGFDADRLVLTAGGAQAIALVASHLGRGWVNEPEFSLYKRYLPVIDPEGPLFRSNPNNPLGALAARGDHADVWDEAFYQMATGQWSRGAGDRDTFVVGSLTKLLACPGLRAGYVVAPDPGIADAIRRRMPAWSVNGLVAAILPAMLEQCDLPSWSAAIVAAREEMAGALEAAGLTVIARDAPWVLVDWTKEAGDLREILARSGILVRSCAGFGMPGIYRLAVVAAEGLDRLMTAVQRVDPAAGSSRPLLTTGRRVGRTGNGRALFVVGTGSNAGKSLVTAGLCRLLAAQGCKVAPFKAQNMSLESYVTTSGGEIARSQALQAVACGLEPSVDMNPLLLKPMDGRMSQLVVLGQDTGFIDYNAYAGRASEMIEIARSALERLLTDNDVVVCEGAGSPAEINLLDRDVVNLPLAREVGAPALLVADIERGGVFAAIQGTVDLLPPGLRGLLKGFIVNKMRGDAGLLENGLQALARSTGLGAFGVLPFIDGMAFDAEDSLARLRTVKAPQPLNGSVPLDVAVVDLPHLANGTDVDPLHLESSVRLRWIADGREVGDPDLVIIPGSRATVADLRWFRAAGIGDAITDARARDEAGGPAVLGICAGYQMMGRSIVDEVEAKVGTEEGMALLPVNTVMDPQKITRRVDGTWRSGSGTTAVSGYEIHHGRITPESESESEGRAGSGQAGSGCWFNLHNPAEPEGWIDERAGLFGTSIHGLFEQTEMRSNFLGLVAVRRGKTWRASGADATLLREQRLDRMAEAIASHLDVDAIFALVGR